MSLRKAIRMTKVNLSELVKGSDEDRQVLETRHIELEGSRRLAVEAERASALAASKAQIARAQANQAHIEFLTFAGNLSNTVATEHNWLPPFRNKDGEICIESPFTIREQRAAAHAMHNQIAKQATDDDGDQPDIFEDEG
jgi:hypothetical protein